MPGFSVTLLLLPTDGNGPATKEQILELLDAQARTHAWVNSSGMPPSSNSAPPVQTKPGPASENPSRAGAPTSSNFSDAVRRACKELIAAEPEITRMDQVLSATRICPHILKGLSRSRAMEIVGLHSSQALKACVHSSQAWLLELILLHIAVLSALDDKGFASLGAAGAIGRIGAIVGDAMGGTSGALYR